MKKIYQIIITVSILSSSLFAHEYAVVSSRDMKSLSASQIKAVFLKKITVTNGVKLVPVNLSARDKIRQKFEKKILHMNFSRLKAYWTKQHYLGHRPPLSMKSQQSVKAFIDKVDGAIGYMEMKNIDKSMKILYKWSD